MMEDNGLMERTEETVLGQGRGGRWEWENENKNDKEENKEKKIYWRMAVPEKKIYGIHTIFNNEMHSIKVQASIFRVERLHWTQAPTHFNALQNVKRSYAGYTFPCVFLLAGCRDVSSLRPDGVSPSYTRNSGGSSSVIGYGGSHLRWDPTHSVVQQTGAEHQGCV